MTTLNRNEIKSWFLNKNEISGIFKEFTVERETEKALLLKGSAEVGYRLKETSFWVPKSCLQNPKDDAFLVGQMYHKYLEDLYHDSYEKGLMGEKRTIKSGRNVYSGDAFVHQLRTDELIDRLNKHNIEFMDKESFKQSL